MSDTSTNGEAAPEEGAPTTPPNLKLLGQYVRDLSFENLAVRNATQLQGQPDIKVRINVDATPKGENRYEVVLKIAADAQNSEEKSIFMAELEYGGLFGLENVEERQVHPIVLIECPRLLFPFARRVMADVSRDGGFPPLMLDPVDFAALYRRKLEEQIASAKAAKEANDAAES